MITQNTQVPYLLLLKSPSRTARRNAARLLRELGAVVVAQYGEVAIEVRMTPNQADAVGVLELFAARLTGPMSKTGLERLDSTQRLYVKQWNTRFRIKYREMKKRPPRRGLPWGSKGLAAPLPYTPVERADLEKILQGYEERTGKKLPKRSQSRVSRKGKQSRFMTREAFLQYEQRLRRVYGDERLSYTLTRVGYRLDPDYRELLLNLPKDLREDLMKNALGATACPEMTGEVAVGIVFVESSLSGGPKFSASERDDICDLILDGLNWLAEQHPASNVSWVFDFQFVKIAVANQSGDPEEDYWRDPGIGKVNYNGNTYSTSWDGVGKYRNDLRLSNSADHAFVIFVTPYNNSWHAYASGGRVTLAKKNDWGNWGRSALDSITAHETCHIFGAADEYTGSSATPCSSCKSLHGCDDIPNGNCGACAKPQQSCVMDHNDLRLCAYTKGQIGWSTIFVELTTADVDYAGTDDTVWLDIGDFSFELATVGHDDRTRGNVEGYSIYVPTLKRADVKRVLIRKSKDGSYGGWRLQRVRAWFDGELICDETVNRWLEDDKRFWVGCISDKSLVNSLTVKVTTANEEYAGTDDTARLRLAGHEWYLDNQDENDFVQGETNTFDLDPGTNFYVKDIRSIQIEKSLDGAYGGWKLKGVQLIVNGSTVYNNQSINKWLKDDDRNWSDTVS